MKASDHLRRQRLRYEDREQIPMERIAAIVADPLRQERQPDGRLRLWGASPELGGRFIRVILLPDGETVLTAFIDGKFRP